MSRKILLLAILGLAVCLLAAGCTSRTVYTESGGITPIPTAAPTHSDGGAAGAKYVRGDIVQPDPSDELYDQNIAAIVTGVGDGEYQYCMVCRGSSSDTWAKAPNYAGDSYISIFETLNPNKIGHADPDTLSTAMVPTATPAPHQGELEILDHEMLWQGNFVYVTGTAKNIGNERISHGSIKVKFYDCEGNLVGNGMDMVSDLDAGETWKFKATAFDTDGEIESYKIGVGSSW